MRNLFLLFILLLNILQGFSQKYSINGYVRDENGEELIGANVFIEGTTIGTVTNSYGFYSLTLPKGTYTLTTSFVGYTSPKIEVELNENNTLNISLEPTTEQIEEVEIYAEGSNTNIQRVEMSTAKLQIKTIKKLPVVFGETDIIKSIRLLPGVTNAHDAASGFNVRGGSQDQNLILLDDAQVYNASHLVGFFSVFNGDAVKDLKLYKGGIPPEFGGRLSSVLDIHMKEGNTTKIRGGGGIGSISSRAYVEGPIVKDKASFMISARRTYADLLLLVSPDSLARQSKFFFYDLNAKVNIKLNDKHRIFLSGYFGSDVLGLGDLIGQNFGNKTGTLRWNYIINPKLFLNATLVATQYKYDLLVEQEVNSINWISGITDFGGNFDLTYFLSPKNTIKMGLSSTYHSFEPGTVTGKLDSIPLDYTIEKKYSLEHAFFIQNEQKFTDKFSVLYGLRLSLFQNIKKASYFNFDESDPTEYTINPLDSVDAYGWGSIHKTHPLAIQPRIMVRYQLNEFSSVKAGYERMYQYIGLATNSTSSTPIDVWYPSTPNIKPQYSDQVAIGYFRNFMNNTIETSLEFYYKRFYNVVDFRDHAQLILNEQYEGEFRIGRGWSYGIELFIKKEYGKFTGWISYTLSKTQRQIPEINNGNVYDAPYDKPHDVSIVMSYDINDKFNISANWIYASAIPRTVPVGRYDYQNKAVPIYQGRNTERFFDYHRLDVALNYNFDLWGGKSKESNLNFSVYNVYMKKNPYAIVFRESEDENKITEAVIYYLYRIVPSITYNIDF